MIRRAATAGCGVIVAALTILHAATRPHTSEETQP